MWLPNHRIHFLFAYFQCVRMYRIYWRNNLLLSLGFGSWTKSFHFIVNLNAKWKVKVKAICLPILFHLIRFALIFWDFSCVFGCFHSTYKCSLNRSFTSRYMPNGWNTQYNSYNRERFPKFSAKKLEKN